MTRIVKLHQPIVIPLTVTNMSATEIRAQIAELEYQKRTGVISESEANEKINMLQAKLEQVENTPVPEIQPQQSETIVEDPMPDTKEPAESESSFEENDFYAQQAEYNKAYHNL